MSAYRWEHLLWPRWLPETARMPVLAQVTGAVALTALIMGPWWARLSTPAPLPVTLARIPAQPLPTPVASAPATTTASDRPAHLNLAVRHTFGNVNMLVTVDGKRVLETRLEGSGKKFKMFGKRSERSFTRTLDLQPGVRVVRVNLKSDADRFDQTRVERFDLSAASVATLRITADKAAGLTATIDRASAVTQSAANAPSSAPPSPPQAAPVTAAAIPLPAAAAPTQQSITQQADALAELLNSLRSMLIAIAGFVASAATGFVVQEYLRSKRGVIFATSGGPVEDTIGPRKERRRRRRSQATPAIEP